jgi:hypothetical protein
MHLGLMLLIFVGCGDAPPVAPPPAPVQTPAPPPPAEVKAPVQSEPAPRDEPPLDGDGLATVSATDGLIEPRDLPVGTKVIPRARDFANAGDCMYFEVYRAGPEDLGYDFVNECPYPVLYQTPGNSPLASLQVADDKGSIDTPVGTEPMIYESTIPPEHRSSARERMPRPFAGDIDVNVSFGMHELDVQGRLPASKPTRRLRSAR